MSKISQALVLAAGESSRFWPLAVNKHKAMYEILGKPILQYTIDALHRVGLKDLIIVIGPKDTTIRQYFGSGKKFGVRIRYVIQRDAEKTGQAGAIRVAKPALNEQFVVVNAGNFSCGVALRRMLHTPTKGIVLAATKTNTPQLYGVFKFQKGKPIGLIEKPKRPSGDQRIIGVYIFNKSFAQSLTKYRSHYGLEAALHQWLRKKMPARVVRLARYPEFPLKYPWHLFAIDRYFMEKIPKHRGKNVQVHSTARLTGNIWLEDRVRVLEYAVIHGPAYIGRGSTIGTHSLIRNSTSIGRNVHTGYHSEIKASILFDDIKLHSCFVGDSILDSGCRFGAGTVTANRRIDRKSVKTAVKGAMVDTQASFFGTICGSNVRTGVGVALMPGVKIGMQTNIGPQTTLFEDVPAYYTTYAKFVRVIRKRR